MESNDSIEVNDNEVPQKTDHNQSDNGLEDSRQEECPSNSEIESIDGQNIASKECKIIDDSTKGKDNSKDDDSSAGGTRHQYSKEQLIQISKLSLARIRPKCLDNTFNNPQNGLWNPEKWISNRSPAAAAAANASNKYNYNKRVDPKDRVLEEESEIILSPQRGSFGTGCHVSSNSFASNKASTDSRNRDHFSERNKSMDESIDGSHRSNINTRRVGSGRIVAKERDRLNDWTDRNYDRTYEHREGRDGRDGRENRDNRNDDFNERRSGRYERRPNREVNSNRNFRFDNNNQRYREHKYREEEDEPEWFTEGPTSKHDTIELRGFDDDSSADVPSKANKDIEEKPKDYRNKDLESNVGNQNNSEPKNKELKEVKKEPKSDDFDVNAMFGKKDEDWFGKQYETQDNKMISSSVGISENVNNESDSNIKSRFKRWFNESPNQAIGSNAAAFSQNNTSNNRQKENLNTASMMRPSNTQMSNPLSPDKIFEMLSNGSNRMSIEQLSNQKFDPRKAMSLAEIEANLSQMDVNNSKGIDDKTAFDKLIFDLNKKSAQTSNTADRARNDVKSETTLMQTPDAHVIIPKSVRNAPSILELLKEQENKEAMADLHRSNRRVVPNQVPSHPNGTNISQNSANNPMFGAHSMPSPGPNPMEVQNWESREAQLMNAVSAVRPPRNPTNQEMSEQTSLMIQRALQARQQMGQQITVRPQPQIDAVRANTPNRNVSNFLIPTSVMRNMHSDKERDSSVKSVMTFNDMTPESNSSQYKFLNENFISKPSPMRPIVKSNHPIGQSVAAKQSPLSPHSDPMAFNANTLAGLPSHLFHTQQTVPQNPYHKPINLSSNTNVRPFNLGQNSMNRTSTPSPNAPNNNPINSNQNILQMFNNRPNVRTNVNQMQMNQMMAFHNSVPEGRQYSQSRPITANNVHQMLLNNTKSDPFNQFERNMSESDGLKTFPISYSQSRPHNTQMQQMFQNSTPSQPNRNTESRFFGQIFGEDSLHHSLPELPTVPLHNALTLDDIERS